MMDVKDFVQTNKSLQKGVPDLPTDMERLIEMLKEIPSKR